MPLEAPVSVLLSMEAYISPVLVYKKPTLKFDIEL